MVDDLQLFVEIPMFPILEKEQLKFSVKRRACKGVDNAYYCINIADI